MSANANRLKEIVTKAKVIRSNHPQMKWQHCVRKASEEIYGKKTHHRTKRRHRKK
jgi:hypothetical protein